MAMQLGSPPPALEARVLALEVRTLASTPPSSLDATAYGKYMGNIDSALSRLAVLGQPTYTRDRVETEFLQLFIAAIRAADHLRNRRVGAAKVREVGDIQTAVDCEL